MLRIKKRKKGNSSLIKWKEFHKNHDTRDDRPLQRCQEWIRTAERSATDKENGRASRYLCLARERPKFVGSGTWRYFLAVTGDEFAKEYQKQMPANSRTWHEIVQRDRPCHLYFDFEFRRLPNNNNGDDDVKLGNQLIDRLLDSCAQLLSVNSFLGQEQRLFSHRADKFSSHVVVRLPENQAFRSSVDCGNFVRQALGKLLQEMDNPDESKVLREMVDLDVYHANHALRMYMSTKVGEERYLRTAEEASRNAVQVDPNTLEQSLITLVDHDARLLVWERQLVSSESIPFYVGASCSSDELLAMNGTNNSDKNQSSWTTNGPPPPPALVTMLQSQFSQYKMDRVLWDPESGRLLVTTTCLQCPVAQRQHTSNHIYFVVHLLKLVYFVHCHNKVCQGILRQRRQKPQPLNKEIRSQVETWLRTQWNPPTLNLMQLTGLLT